MKTDNLLQVLEGQIDDVSTHYEGCWRSHRSCAMARAAARIRILEARVEVLGYEYHYGQDRIHELEAFVGTVEKAHQEHLQTGDYAKLGMATQDALRVLSTKEEKR